MTQQEIEVAILALILKISVINGVNIPDKESMPILVEEMIIQFRNRYDMLNVDEIMYAFRNYKSNDWGKNFNLKYFDDIIQQYIYRRKEVSELEQGYSKPKEIEYIPVTITDDEMLEDLQYYVDKYHPADRFTNDFMMLLPLYLYDYMNDLNLINQSQEQKDWLMEKAIAIRVDQINEETRITNNNQNGYYQLMLKKSMKEKNVDSFPEFEKHRVENIYKKLIIFDYIKNAKKG
jgi:hypothetical protein